MFRHRRLLFCAALLPSLAALAGCSSLFPTEHRQQHTNQGGFSVRVVADIGEYAQHRGFARVSAKAKPQFDPATHAPLPSPPDVYRSGGVILEVSDDPTEHRVSAYLHGAAPGSERSFIERFYHDYDKEFGHRYGPTDPISESAFADDSGAPLKPSTLESGATPDADSPRSSGIPPVSSGQFGSPRL
jgi:hypothetical protein